MENHQHELPEARYHNPCTEQRQYEGFTEVQVDKERGGEKKQEDFGTKKNVRSKEQRNENGQNSCDRWPGSVVGGPSGNA